MSGKLFWFKDAKSNFGDLLGPYIYQKLTGKKAKYTNPKKNKKDTILLTAGSIMRHSKKNTIIWGSGIIVKDEKIKQPKKILAVRGKETRNRLLNLKIDCPEIYGDPALLLPLIFKPQTTKKYKLGIIPHWKDYKEIKKKFKNEKDLKIINLIAKSNKDIEKIIKQINQCQRIASSSLHGIIVSHAYQIPAIWIKVSNKLYGDNIKFHDYYSSININSICYNFVNKEISTKHLNSLLDHSVQPQFPIDTTKLKKSCPWIKS